MEYSGFHSELFEYRGQAIQVLKEHGFEWLSHYPSIDPMHDGFGLEVCGIAERSDAESILAILHRTFPTWRYAYIFEKDWGDRDMGWWVRVHRDPERDTAF